MGSRLGRFLKLGLFGGAPSVDILEGLEAYYRLDYDLDDSSGNGRRLDADPSTAYGDGVIGGGLAALGAVGVANPFPMTTGAYSLSGWVLVGAEGGYDSRPLLGFATPKHGVVLLPDPGGQLAFYYANTLVSIGSYSYGWHHFALTWNGTGSAAAYVDGAKVGTASGLTPASLAACDFFLAALDATGGASLSPPALDEAAVWSRALSAAEVAALYNGGAGLDPTLTDLPVLFGKVGVNLGPPSYFDSQWLSPDLILTGYPYRFQRYQAALASDHVSGQGWVLPSATLAFPTPSPGLRTGAVGSSSFRVRDAATSTTLSGNGFTVVGTGVMYPNGAITNDRAVLAGAFLDSTDANTFSANSSFLGLNANFVDGSRDTGYPDGIKTGQTFSNANLGAGRRLPLGDYTPLAKGDGRVQLTFGYIDGTTSGTINVDFVNGVASLNNTANGGSATDTKYTITKQLNYSSSITVAFLSTGSTVGDPVRDFMLVMPDRAGHSDGFAATLAANINDPYYVLFHPTYKESLEFATVLRAMDWHATNNSVAKDWADRTLPGRQAGLATVGGAKTGMPYEVAVQLCNEMGADYWVCIPHEATDDYVTQLATLLVAELDPGRRVYVEYSNETWNSAIFDQYHYSVAAGINYYSNYALSSLTYSSGTGLCTATLRNTTCAALGFANGDTVVIANATDANYNGAFTIGNVSGSTFTYTPGSAPAGATAAANPVTGLIAYETSDANVKTVSSAVWTQGTTANCVVTTSVSHGWASTDLVVLTGFSDPAFNGIKRITAVTATTFTFQFDGTKGNALVPAVSAATVTVNGAAAAGQTMRAIKVGSNSGTGNQMNNFAANRRWTGKRSGEVLALFRAAFPDSRISMVLPFQAAGNSTSNDALVTAAFDAALGGTRPPDVDYCWAIAPYFGSQGISDSAFTGTALTVSSISYSAGTVTVTTSGSHGYTTGDTVQVLNVGTAGAGGDPYNGVFTITVTGATTFTYPVGVAPTTTSGASATFSSLGMKCIKNPPYMRELASATRVGTTVTCVSYGHGLVTGDVVRLANYRQDDYKVSVTVTVTDADTFTFQTASTLSPTLNSGTGRGWVVKYAGVTKILDDTEAHLEGTVPGWLTYQAAQATADGSRLVCYEGGPHSLASSANQPFRALVDAYAAANTDARMGELTEAWLEQLDAAGVELVCWYNHIQPPAISGTWGLLDYQTQTGNPKYDALETRG